MYTSNRFRLFILGDLRPKVSERELIYQDSNPSITTALPEDYNPLSTSVMLLLSGVKVRKLGLLRSPYRLISGPTAERAFWSFSFLEFSFQLGIRTGVVCVVSRHIMVATFIAPHYVDWDDPLTRSFCRDDSPTVSDDHSYSAFRLWLTRRAASVSMASHQTHPSNGRGCTIITALAKLSAVLGN